MGLDFAVTVQQFFLLAPEQQDRIWELQQRCKGLIEKQFPEGPPYLLAIRDGSRLVYPVMPDGSFIWDEGKDATLGQADGANRGAPGARRVR